jgi:type VI secretion system protein ImpC
MPTETEQETTTSAAAEAGTATLLDEIVAKGGMAKSEAQVPYARDLVTEFATQVLDEGMVVTKDTVTSINERIAKIDELISNQLNAIMHHEEFQRLESAWRGLHFFVKNTETGSLLKIRLLNISKKDLLSDSKNAVEFDQSGLFKMIYEEEYGTFGGHPYSLLLGDYEFGRMPEDVHLLEYISNVASAAHAPFIAAASPKLFDFDSFAELSGPRDLAKIFESAELIKWRSFRASDDSRYVSLVLPHILLRLPYGSKTMPVEGVNFEEEVNGDHKKYLWGNAAYALGTCITRAFARHNWCAAIRGLEGGGIVEGLPSHTFKTDEGDIALKCPTEIAITDRRENELNELGFISLCHCKNTDYAAFFGGKTANKARKFDTDAANANAILSTMLPYMLSASRFAHYIKAIVRDKVGTYETQDSLSRYLNRWIATYTIGTDDSGPEMKSKYPLRESRIDLVSVPGRPGSFRAVVFVRPHFQLEDLSVSIRLVANLPEPAA